jgi:hypothetical protein
VPPTPLLAGGGEHLAYRLPEPQGTVTDREHRCGHPAAAAIAQQIRPAFGRFPEAVGDGDQFLAAIRSHADHHQQAEFFLFKADFEVNPIHPQIDVIGA